MKTILVEAVYTFIVDGKINLELKQLLDKFPNEKIILTNANDEEMITYGLVDLPYELYTLKHNPDKTDPNYFKKLLEDKGIWQSKYHSKTIDKVIDNEYDLVVTVCDHASQTCPMFPKAVKVIHVGFEDPDGKGFEAFEATYKEIDEILLQKVVEVLK